MPEYNLSEIARRLKWGGQLSSVELDYLKQRIRNPEQDEDLYNMIRALGLGAPPTPENVALVEKYFTSEVDEWVLQAVIYALCDYWALTKNYLDQLLFYTRLENWERYSSAAIAAFGALGDYLEETQDARIYHELVGLFDREMALITSNSSESQQQHLELVYEALDRGIRGRKQALLGSIEFRFPEDVDLQVLNEARKRSRE